MRYLHSVLDKTNFIALGSIAYRCVYIFPPTDINIQSYFVMVARTPTAISRSNRCIFSQCRCVNDLVINKSSWSCPAVCPSEMYKRCCLNAPDTTMCEYERWTHRKSFLSLSIGYPISGLYGMSDIVLLMTSLELNFNGIVVITYHSVNSIKIRYI